ncbi:MAG: hypothetical protein ABIJ05_03710 [Patescibacteria group bacterium]
MLKKLTDKLQLPKWLCIFLFLILLLRVPSFFEPYFYGDEMIYMALGQGIRQGIPLYRGVYDNKPPLLYIMAAIAGNLFWFKVILAFANIISIYFFWKLSQILFPKNNLLHKISTIIFGLLTTLPLLEGNIVNAELFMVTPIIVSLIIIFSKKNNFKNLFIAGSLFSIASLFKMPAFFDLPAVIVFWLIYSISKKTNFILFIKKTIYLLIGFAIPILLSFIWFYIQGSLKDYVFAAYLQNVGYLSSWRPSDTQKPFLIRNLPLLTRGFIILLSSILLYFKRKKLSKNFIFITLWLLFGLFGVTLSERPYPHYLIQVVPAISLLFGMLFTEETFEQSLTLIPLTIAFFVPVFFNYYHYPTLSYYSRFVNLLSGKISKKEYLLSFDKNAIRNYDISSFLISSMDKKEKVLVTGNSATIYALSRKLPPIKYVADYHINDYSSLQNEVDLLSQDLPRFIILLPQKMNLTPLIPVIRENYILVSEIDGAEIWKISSLKQ